MFRVSSPACGRALARAVFTGLIRTLAQMMLQEMPIQM
jgi:hypothetical protein